MELTTDQKKYLTIAGIVAIIGGVVWYANKSANDGNTGASLDPTGNGSNAPIPVGGAFNAKNIAEDLYIAMYDSGTDEATIIDVLTHVNQTQFEQVFVAFGRRGYNKINGSNSFPFWSTITKYDLKTWLKEELSDADYRILKLKYPKYL
jgi:hypothetical protein